MKKVLVIAGPTASGKTAFSLRCAKEFGAEIISGDSIQVYRGMDIGSGKVTAQEMGDVVHHLIDILEPAETYSAADFQRMVRDIIDRSDRRMILCGGTGMYIKGCLYDYIFEQEAEGDPQEEVFRGIPTDELYRLLLATDPEQAQKIHPNNRRRIERTLTIYRRTGKKQSDIIASQEHRMVYDTFIAGCTMDRSKLYARINARVEGMFRDGLEDEVRRLLDAGVSFSAPGMKGIGYREWEPYFAGTCTIDDVKEAIQKNSRHFARRQYTWLNHQMPVHWFDVTDENDVQRMIGEIRTWYGEDTIPPESDE